MTEERAGLPIHAFVTQAKWRAWLKSKHQQDVGVWLKFAKKASGIKSVTYEEAREVAIIYGWIDGQKGSFDHDFYLIRFTPRRKRSIWSKINVAIANELIASGAMKPAGMMQVELAKADGRWDAAYDPPSTMTVHPDFKKALATSKSAASFFKTISKTNRYAILHAIQTAKRDATRESRINKYLAMLEAGDVPHPDRERKTKAPKTPKKTRAKVKAKATSQGPQKGSSGDVCVAFLRGINVGGKNRLPMKTLAAICAELGAKNVSTIIQSGNVIFRATKTVQKTFAKKLEQRLFKDLKLRVPIIIRGAASLKAIGEVGQLVAEHPLRAATDDPKRLYVALLQEKPKATAMRHFDHDKYAPDRVKLSGDVAYLAYPNGMARTKLTSAVLDRNLGTITSQRNLNTLDKILQRVDTT